MPQTEGIAAGSVLAGLISRDDLAKEAKKCTRTIRMWEAQGLRCIRVGKSPYYDIAQARAFIRGEPQPRRRGRRAA